MSPYAVTWNLVVQQMALRYRRAWLGILWLVLVPLATMAAMGAAVTIIFGAHQPGMILHILVSMLPFTFFGSVVNTTSGSLLGYQEIIRRHAVNRMVFPAATVIICIIEYLISSLSLVFLGGYFGAHLNASFASVLLGFLCIATFGAALGLLGSVGTVYFRDLAYLIHVTLTLWYWVTPIIYRMEMIGPELRRYFYLNPLALFLSMYTDPLVKGTWPPTFVLLTGPAVAVAALLVAVVVFRRAQKRVVFYL